MIKTKKTAALLLVVVATFAATEECCDANHATYVQANTNSQETKGVCIARGGVPIGEMYRDDGGHTFYTLKQCAFPCDQRAIQVEK